MDANDTVKNGSQRAADTTFGRQFPKGANSMKTLLLALALLYAIGCATLTEDAMTPDAITDQHGPYPANFVIPTADVSNRHGAESL